MTGQICILGLGPARPEHMTLEAATTLRQASGSKWRCYGLAHARELARSANSEIEVQALDYLYEIPGVSRPAAYADLAKMLCRKAIAGHRILYIVAGSPLFYNDAVLLIRREAKRRSIDLKMITGMSFVDIVLQGVHWTGHHGLQLYSAWNIAQDHIPLNEDVPTLLCQLGEFSSGGDAITTSGSNIMLQKLRDKLLSQYPKTHPVSILSSSGAPDYNALANRIALEDLALNNVPVYSNLFIPGISHPEEADT